MHATLYNLHVWRLDNEHSCVAIHSLWALGRKTRWFDVGCRKASSTGLINRRALPAVVTEVVVGVGDMHVTHLELCAGTTAQFSNDMYVQLKWGICTCNHADNFMHTHFTHTCRTGALCVGRKRLTSGKREKPPTHRLCSTVIVSAFFSWSRWCKERRCTTRQHMQLNQ